MRVEDLLEHAHHVLDHPDGRFEDRLAAAVRNAGHSGRLVHQLTADERIDVDDVLTRVGNGSHEVFLRAGGDFEVRRALRTHSAARKTAARGWGTGRSRFGAAS